MSDESTSIDSHVPSLVLFDLDDTLCDHYRSLRLRLRLAFDAALSGVEGIDINGLVEEAAVGSVGGIGHLADLFRGHGIVDSSRCDVAIQHFRSDRYRGLELFQDSVSTIRYVSRYAQVGLITNGPSKIQRDKIERLAIGDLFGVILVSEEEGVWKPDPVIFQRAMARIGATPEQAVYIGDSPEHDIAGAQAAGMVSIWINRRGRSWPGGKRPDYEIKSLIDLPGLLGLSQPTTTTTM